MIYLDIRSPADLILICPVVLIELLIENLLDKKKSEWSIISLKVVLEAPFLHRPFLLKETAIL